MKMAAGCCKGGKGASYMHFLLGGLHIEISFIRGQISGCLSCILLRIPASTSRSRSSFWVEKMDIGYAKMMHVWLKDW